MLKFFKKYFYIQKFHWFLNSYEYFSYDELLSWQQGLREDICFGDKNPYNKQMLLLIERQIEKQDD